MPDSLCQGFGWWRITFTANPELLKDIERLYFYSWGADEIYLDGELVGTYGSFSNNSQSEKTYTLNYDCDRPLKITQKNIHTLAIRFSNHQAKKIIKYLGTFLKIWGLTLAFQQQFVVNFQT
jgi:hypothetical protein